VKRLLIILFLITLLPSQPAQSKSLLGVQIQNIDFFNWADIKVVGASTVKIQVFAEDQAEILYYQPASKVISFINDAHNQGLNVLLSVEGNRFDPIGHLPQLQNFIQTVAPYENTGDYLEVWNEENSPDEFHGTIDQYRRVYTAVYNSVKSVSPAKVIIGALQPNPTESVWASNLRQLSASCQGIHYEDYPFHTLRQRLDQIRIYYPGRHLCFTEIGVLSSEGLTLPSNFFWAQHTSRQDQAIILKQIVTSLSKISNLIIIFNVDFTSTPSDPMSGYNLIYNQQCLFCK